MQGWPRVSRDQMPKQAPSCLKASDLISSQSTKKLIDSLAKNLNLNPHVFNSLYQNLVENFASFTQELPTPFVRFKDQSNILWLNHALTHAVLALKIHHQEMKLNSSSFPKDEAPLYDYVIASSALLHQIGRVINYEVQLWTDIEQKQSVIWYPALGAMPEQKGQSYKLLQYSIQYDFIPMNTSPIIAQNLMPAFGFQLIAKNKVALGNWLQGVIGDPNAESEGINNILNLAKSILMEHLSLHNDLPTEEEMDIAVNNVSPYRLNKDFFNENESLEVTISPDDKYHRDIAKWLGEKEIKKTEAHKKSPIKSGQEIIEEWNILFKFQGEQIMMSFPSSAAFQHFMAEFVHQFPGYRYWRVMNDMLKQGVRHPQKENLNVNKQSSINQHSRFFQGQTPKAAAGVQPLSKIRS